MSVTPKSLRWNVKQLAERHRAEMVPLGNRFCYLATSVQLSEEDLKEYLDEPVAALPTAISALLPPVQILLVPYLENSADGVVATEKTEQQAEPLHSSVISTPQGALLAFAVKDTEVADHHYRFYRAIAELVAGPKAEAVPAEYQELLRAEFALGAHGEVDETSWKLKSELTAADQGARRTKRFKEYARASFVDTLTLYLHGICCDIDVDPGPRQLASYLLRRRLRYLRGMYPPPKGYAVLPEDEKG